MNNHFYKRALRFKVHPLPIDYYSVSLALGQFIRPSDEINLCTNVLGEGEQSDYLTDREILPSGSTRNNETVIIDVPVGKGKTESIYRLIATLAESNENVLILASPFQKLVEKDYQKLKSRVSSIFSYEDINETNVDTAIPHQVHVMSINCLLKNPGESAFEARKDKQWYIDGLLARCRRENRKVVIFIDELHESIDVFKPEYIPNFTRWRDVAFKVFIASATYTSSALPIFKYCTSLTSSNVRVTEYIRTKNPEVRRSRLILNFVQGGYSKDNLSPLFGMEEPIAHAHDRVYILTANKTVSEGLYKLDGDRADLSNLKKLLSDRDFKLLVSGSKKPIPFSELNNNIGTTFKTGVDITRQGGVFIIVLPSNDDFSKTVFNDGIPSIIQAIARLRAAGDIHVFMPFPKSWLKVQGSTASCEYFDTLPSVPYRNQNDALRILQEIHARLRVKHEAEIEELQRVHSLNYHYPTLDDFLLTDGQKKLVKNDVAYGKDLPAYILWAALHSQFVNADLVGINVYRRRKRLVNFDTLLNSIMMPQHTLADVIHIVKGDREDLSSPILQRLRANSGDIVALKNGKLTSLNTIDSDPHFTSHLIKKICLLHNLDPSRFKQHYILHSITASIGAPKTELSFAYQMLNYARTAFLILLIRRANLHKGKLLIDKTAYEELPHSLTKVCLLAIRWVKEHDIIISSKAVSFLQGVEGKTIEEQRRAIYREFLDLFVDAEYDSLGKLKRYTLAEKNDSHRVLERCIIPLPESPFLYNF